VSINFLRKDDDTAIKAVRIIRDESLAGALAKRSIFQRAVTMVSSTRRFLCSHLHHLHASWIEYTLLYQRDDPEAISSS